VVAGRAEPLPLPKTGKSERLPRERRVLCSDERALAGRGAQGSRSVSLELRAVGRLLRGRAKALSGRYGSPNCV
jgi:hypothetical protein